MTKVALIQKCPSTTNWDRELGFPTDLFNLSSEKRTKLLKRDIDLPIISLEAKQAGFEGFCEEYYDYIIVVGSEPTKHFTKVTAVSDLTGRLVDGKSGKKNYIPCISPAMLAFKPETKPVFDASVKSIKEIVSGKGTSDVLDGDYALIDNCDDALKYLQYVRDLPTTTVAHDSETSSLSPRRGHMLGISMSHCLHQGRYILADVLDDLCLNVLQEIFEVKEAVFHNAKFDLHFFKYHLGIDFKKAKIIHDTMVQHYLLDERQGTHGLKALTLKYGSLGDYDRPLEEFKTEYCRTHGIKQEDFSYDLIPIEVIWPYAAKDTAATLELHNKFLPIINNSPQLSGCYYNLMLPALMFLTDMEYRGIPISKNRLLAARGMLEQELDDLRTKLYNYPEVVELEKEQAKIFNPNSVNQLRVLLFDKLGLDNGGALTATGALSTDSEVLQDLALQHPVANVIHEIRKKTKLLSTYVVKLSAVIDRDNRVRTGFNLTSTTSGRLSSSGNFNVQQLPRDNPLIKGCVKARPGYKIVAVDLTTAEVYFAAVLSGDKNMQQVFINMKNDPDKYPDFHSNIAHMVFHLKCEPKEVKKLHPALRQGAKAITFGILYGSGAAKVAESVNLALMEQGLEPTCTKEEAQDYINTYFRQFARLKQWIESCHQEIRTNGYIYNFFGRKRRLFNIRSSDRGVVAGEIRSGFNAIIQSVSSDHLLLGALEADKEILARGLDANIFALVHDSVVAEVREDQVDEYIQLLKTCIQKDRGCSIPGAPIGVDEDSEPGGSADYSSGKLAKFYPHIAEI